MNRFKTLALYILTCLVGLALIIIPAAQAAPVTQERDAGLLVSNAKLELTMAPGESYVHNMVVSLGAQARPLDISVEARGFGETLEGSFLPLEAGQDLSPYSARTFITGIDVPQFRLEPGGSQPLNVTIELPADAGANPRYAMIYLHSHPVDMGDGVANILATSVPVVITPRGAETQRTGSITDLKVNTAGAGKPIEILTTVQNTGNYHYKALSEAIITDAQGQVMATVKSPPAGTSIIPTFSQQLRAAYALLDRPDGLPAGAYGVKVNVSMEDGTPLDTREVSFSIEEPYRPLPDIALEDLVIVTFNNELPGMVDARAKAGVQISFRDTDLVTGQAAVGKYRQEPPGVPGLSAPVADGGMGTPGLSHIGAQVDGFSQGTAEFKVFYSDADLGGANPNSLYLAYRAGDYWRKLDNLAVYTGAGVVQGELPVRVLNSATVIALAGDAPAAAPQVVAVPKPELWPMAAAIAAGGLVAGLLIALIVARGRRLSPR